MAADIDDGGGEGDVAEVALGMARGRGFDVVEWGGAVFERVVEVEVGDDGAAMDVGFGDGGDGRRSDCLSNCGHCRCESGDGLSEVVFKLF